MTCRLWRCHEPLTYAMSGLVQQRTNPLWRSPVISVIGRTLGVMSNVFPFPLARHMPNCVKHITSAIRTSLYHMTKASNMLNLNSMYLTSRIRSLQKVQLLFTPSPLSRQSLHYLQSCCSSHQVLCSWAAEQLHASATPLAVSRCSNSESSSSNRT